MDDSPNRAKPVKARIRPDGKFTLPWLPGDRPERDIAAAGKTAEQLQREIAAAVAGQYPTALVFVTLFSPGSPDQLRLEFDNALKEAAERRNNARQ